MLDSNLWWSGPEWLKLNPAYWPSNIYQVDTPPELKEQSLDLLNVASSLFPFNKFSSFVKLKRAIAYILRWKNASSSNKAERKPSSLSAAKLKLALTCLVILIQAESFPDEISALSRGKSPDPKSKIFNLASFLDENGIIRGRLKKSDFSYKKRHPAVLDSRHFVTRLLFNHEHLTLLHAGPQMILSSIREKFWPIGCRNLSRSIVRTCIKCFRFNPKNVEPIMGNFPRDRATPTSPFSISGVDYAGPLLIKVRKVRKCYICVFICFATKPMHLELV